MKRFWIGFLAGLLLPVVLLTIVLAMFQLGLYWRARVPDQATLVVELSGEFPELPGPVLPFPLDDAARRATLRNFWELFDRAAKDPRVRAVLLEIGSLDVGWGRLQELAWGIDKLRRANKSVVAYLRVPGARQYYLACGAGQVYVSPESWLDLKGLRAELVYLADGLRKLGVQVELERAGRYKDAGDMFTRNTISPETRETMDAILDELYGDLVRRIAKGRGMPEDKVRQLLDQGPFLAQQAARERLVDGLLYPDQVEDRLRQQLGQERLRKVFSGDYLRATAKRPRRPHRVAFLVAQGTILPGEEDDWTGHRLLFSDTFRRWVDEIRDDQKIEAVLLRIDSPGGDAVASDEILRALKQLRARKPLVISMSDTAASGGYYIAMTGDPIVAYPGTVTGSIGVLYGKLTLRGLYEKLGMRKVILKRGQFADIDSDYEPLSEKAREKLREGVNRSYQAFLEKVAEGRKTKIEQVRQYAEGRVWLGSQAARHRLVDVVGGFDAALAKVRELARIPPDEPIVLIPYPPRRPLLDILENILASQWSWLRWGLKGESLGSLLGALRPGPWALMPWSIEFH